MTVFSQNSRRDRTPITPHKQSVVWGGPQTKKNDADLPTRPLLTFEISKLRYILQALFTSACGAVGRGLRVYGFRFSMAHPLRRTFHYLFTFSVRCHS